MNFKVKELMNKVLNLSISTLLILALSVIPDASLARKKKANKKVYLKEYFISVYKNSNRYSEVLTTISCGHPMRVVSGDSEWLKVKVGLNEGYIRKDYTAVKRPKCFQDKYPRFFEKMNLSITDLYLWGKLYGNYLNGKTEARPR